VLFIVKFIVTLHVKGLAVKYFFYVTIMSFAVPMWRRWQVNYKNMEHWVEGFWKGRSTRRETIQFVTLLNNFMKSQKHCMKDWLP